MKANQAEYPVTMMCRLLDVSTSGYYAWLKRPPSRRSQEDEILTERIRYYHGLSDGIYGAPRILEDLQDEGIRIGQKRVARLMRSAGLEGVGRRKGVCTTVRKPGAQGAPDLVNRDFSADRPNRLWVADITYIHTWAGFLFLAVVLDAFSRRIVGWSMANHLHTELVLDALQMAVEQRRPEGVIHHSDRAPVRAFNPVGQMSRSLRRRELLNILPECRKAAGDQAGWQKGKRRLHQADGFPRASSAWRKLNCLNPRIERD